MSETFKRTPAEHRNRIAERFLRDFTAKYDKGQREHGGVLERKPTLGHAIEEMLDFPSYLYTLADHLAEVTKRLSGALDLMLVDSDARKLVAEALNIINLGNPEAEREPGTGAAEIAA